MIRPLLISTVLLVAGCTFQPGVSFGTLADASLVARFQPPASRLDAEGRLKTASGYRLRIDSLQLVPRQLDFQATTGKAGTGGSFDPANPPAGYSLCHGGHCHRDDGALISYEEIEAELSGGSLATVTVLSLPAATPFDLLSGSATASLMPAPSSRQLNRGQWSNSVLQLATLTASGSVEDTTAFNRLGGQTRSWSLTLNPSAFSQKIDVTIDREHGERLAIASTFTLSETLWDGIDFQTLAATPGTLVLDQHTATKAQLGENLAKSQFNVTLTP